MSNVQVFMSKSNCFLSQSPVNYIICNPFKALLHTYLRKHISSINKQVATRHVSRSVTRKVKIKALDLLHMALSSQYSHAVRLVKCLRTCTHLCVEESRRNNIHASEFAPFPSEGLSEMCDKGFAAVVDWLIGWYVDDVGAHAGCDDEVAETLTLEDLAGVFR